jgi:uncharacterized UPF0160 family protein
MAKIAVDNGCFHADDSLSVYLLKQLPEFQNAEVIRTREQSLLDECDVG